MVILDFGAQLPDFSGTESLSETFDFTNSEIEDITLYFGLGYFLCTEEDTTTLTLAIGTSNYDRSADSKAGGEAWAHVVKEVANVVLESPEETKQVAIWGGDDMEVGWSAGSEAYSWAVGYNDATESPYVDYGGAEGCPVASHTNGTCTGGYSGWDQNLEYLLNWGLADALSTPEIYFNPPPGSPVNAKQWTEIDQYADENLEGCIFFQGPLDEDGYEGSNTSSQAWDELKSTLETGLGSDTSSPYCYLVPKWLEFSLEI
jgi:hypothetical protein